MATSSAIRLLQLWNVFIRAIVQSRLGGGRGVVVVFILARDLNLMSSCGILFCYDLLLPPPPPQGN